MMMPGVVSPWIAYSPDITNNAMASHSSRGFGERMTATPTALVRAAQVMETSVTICM